MIRITKEDLPFAKHIQLIRSAKKISRRQVAQDLGVSCQQYFKYETGENRVTVGRLAKIAKALDVSVWELIPPEISNNPMFNSQIDIVAYNHWIKLNQQQKRNAIRILRSMFK